jgi:uncharacterized membrane protein YcaP (DUF421 family)
MCTLDLYKIFIGESINLCPILEIIFRTSFMYFYTILNIRLMDKRSMGQLSSFDIIIIIALGTSVGDPMFYTHVPLIQAMVVISTIVLLERLLSKLIDKNKWIESFIVGNPVLIVKNGEPIFKALDQQSIALNELYSFLRIKGIKNLGEVEYAYLEPSGNISILKAEKPTQGLSTINNKP